MRAYFAAVITFLVISPLCTSLPAAAAENRVALVIGNSKYPSAPLKNPVNDANAMAKKLKDLGFEVIVRINVSQREMTRAISAFGEKLTHGSVGLFYYAGHGLQARGRNYLVPIDAEISSESMVGTESVDVERVLEQLNGARLSMVILDACRNNPFERRFRSGGGGGLAQIDAPAGTLIAYATSPGKVALDGEGANGTYTEALLQAMDAPGLKVEDVFKQVRIGVLKATQNMQIPWESSSLTGEFMFRAPNAVVAEPVIRKAEADAAAAALREQMAALTAEVAKLREIRATPSPVPAINDEEQKKAQKEAATLREHLALMNTEIAKLRESRPAPAATPAQQAQQAKEQKQTEQATATLKAQVASLNTELTKLQAREATPEEREAWKKQLSKLHPHHGKLTFPTAFSLLLDITAEADIAKLRAFERTVERKQYNNALAMGVDAMGLISWGGSYNQRSKPIASEIAVDFCQRSSGTNCKAVTVNDSFDEKAWIDAMSLLAAQPVEAVRAAFLKSLDAGLDEATAGLAASTAGRPGKGYTARMASAPIVAPNP